MATKKSASKKIGRLAPRVREFLVLCDDVSAGGPDAYLKVPTATGDDRQVPSLGRAILAVGGTGDIAMIKELKNKGLVTTLTGDKGIEARVTETGHELVEAWRDQDDMP